MSEPTSHVNPNRKSKLNRQPLSESTRFSIAREFANGNEREAIAEAYAVTIEQVDAAIREFVRPNYKPEQEAT